MRPMGLVEQLRDHLPRPTRRRRGTCSTIRAFVARHADSLRPPHPRRATSPASAVVRVGGGRPRPPPAPPQARPLAPTGRPRRSRGELRGRRWPCARRARRRGSKASASTRRRPAPSTWTSTTSPPAARSPPTSTSTCAISCWLPRRRALSRDRSRRRTTCAGSAWDELRRARSRHGLRRLLGKARVWCPGPAPAP